jgi:hypothetical protein
VADVAVSYRLRTRERWQSVCVVYWSAGGRPRRQDVEVHGELPPLAAALAFGRLRLGGNPDLAALGQDGRLALYVARAKHFSRERAYTRTVRIGWLHAGWDLLANMPSQPG